MCFLMWKEMSKCAAPRDVPECTYDPGCLVTDEKTGYKHYTDEEDHVTARPGIDVSEFQGEEIDWKKVRDAGFEFVILRIGYRAYGESGRPCPGCHV